MSGKKTVVTKSAENILADGEYVLGLFAEHRAAVTAADRGKRRQLAPRARVLGWSRDLERARSLVRGRRLRTAGALSATSDVAGARAALHALLVELRDDLELRCDDVPLVARAFGFGGRLRLRLDSTNALLEIAGAARAAWEAGGNREVLAGAGVTGRRIATIEAARKHLRDVRTQRTTVYATTIGATLVKNEALRRVRANTAAVRRIIDVVFRDEPEVRERFRCQLPRHVPKKRK